MDSKMGASANYQMSYFQPASQLIQDEDHDTLILDLTGFKKDQLKIQLTREPRILKISGARQLEDNRWIGFTKDFPVSQDCDSQKISARFDDGVLFVTMPKLISPAEKEDSEVPTSETQKPQTSTEEPIDTPEKNREQASQKTLASDDQNEQTIAEKVAEKSLEKDKTEPSNAKSQEQDLENKSASDDQDKQNIANNVPEKSLEKKETESSNADNQNEQTIAKNVAEKSLEKDKAESSNAKSQEQELENTSASDDQDKQNIANNVSEKSLEKKETESSNADNKNVKEKSAEGKYNSIDDDQNANRSSSDKGKEFSSKGTGQNMNSLAKASANASGPVAMLKMARQKMNLVLFVLLAFLIALYVSNLIWYSKKAEN